VRLQLSGAKIHKRRSGMRKTKWHSEWRGHTVDWLPKGRTWVVDGKRLPKRGPYDETKWKLAVVAWQEALYESFKVLNKEVQDLTTRVEKLKKT
jgi:hypothetical protein